MPTNPKSPRRVQIVGQRSLLVVEGPLDGRIKAIADRQRGRVSRRQLLAAGLSPQMVKTRVARGQLVPTRRGIYAAGPADIPLARETEAILVCGPSARLSHMTAARLWELDSGYPSADRHDTAGHTIHVTVGDDSRGRSHRGVAVYRSSVLQRETVRLVRSLPVTSVERTLVDIGGHATARRHERALDEALARGLTNIARLERVVAETRINHPGVRQLRALLAERRGPTTVTHSEAEELLLALIREAGLPEPRLQAHLHGYSVDVYWPQARFAVEIDGYAWHTTKTKFTRDRRKDRVLADHGVTLTRVTWGQLHEETLPLIAHFARRLALRDTTKGGRI